MVNRTSGNLVWCGYSQITVAVGKRGMQDQQLKIINISDEIVIWYIVERFHHGHFNFE